MSTDYDDYYDASKKDGEVIQGKNGYGQIDVFARESSGVLLAALQEIAGMTFDPWTNGARAGEIARAAIAKATKP